MNREIKFRAWDKQYKSMSNVNMILFSANEIDIDGNLGEPKSLDHYELMQYTGLQDKNGKEIYEGDIVEAWSEGSKGIFQIKWRQEGSPCWLLYPNGQHGKFWNISATQHYPGKQFIGVDAKITETDKIGFYDDGLEVIGNIYENPELLNKQ